MEIIRIFKNALSKHNLDKSKQKIAKMLATNTKTLSQFETKYTSLESDNYKNIDRNTTVNVSAELINKIADELTDGCIVINIADGKITEEVIHKNHTNTKNNELITTEPVSLDTLMAIPAENRPELTSIYVKRDMPVPSYITLLEMLRQSLESKNPKKKRLMYHMFRKGLDVLDIDEITYEIISMNKNSMSFWLPKIAKAVFENTNLNIPNTKIVKVPLPILQMTRLDYASHTKSTLEIINKWAANIFKPVENKTYFVKTGTNSMKFDFRNAKIEGKELNDLGEYLLYIHSFGIQMADTDIKTGKSMYGMSTTNEWVVRDFIKDNENLCIYHGMPLHTEYRVFADFDTKEIIGIHPYWDPNVMKDRFDNYSDNMTPDMLHDSVTYRAKEPSLMAVYEENKERVIKETEKILSHCPEMTGQWSIDIMQTNDNKLWLIDMAIAENSAFYDCIPENKRKPMTENWIPKIK